MLAKDFCEWLLNAEEEEEEEEEEEDEKAAPKEEEKKPAGSDAQDEIKRKQLELI